MSKRSCRWHYLDSPHNRLSSHNSLEGTGIPAFSKFPAPLEQRSQQRSSGRLISFRRWTQKDAVFQLEREACNEDEY